MTAKIGWFSLMRHCYGYCSLFIIQNSQFDKDLNNLEETVHEKMKILQPISQSLGIGNM